MSESTDAIRDDTLDEAMFRSWNKQKKEYQDEIRHNCAEPPKKKHNI